MPARRVLQPPRLLWLAPALLGLLASPGVARGGCGDHARPAVSGVDLGLAALAGLDRAALGTRDLPSPTAPRRPCDGPSCSGQRHATPTATPPAPRIAPERGLVAPRAETPHVSGARSDLARLRPAYTPPALDRPERPPRP